MSTPRFFGDEPLVRFMPDGRNVILESVLSFYDSKGTLWQAHPGKITDGASIPQLLWFWIGGPYEGLHRDAAILHDEAYGDAPAAQASLEAAQESRERARADRMIHEGTLCRIEERWAASTLWKPLRWIWYAHERAKARAIYIGLRLGGAAAWYGHARENAR